LTVTVHGTREPLLPAAAVIVRTAPDDAMIDADIVCSEVAEVTRELDTAPERQHRKDTGKRITGVRGD
jgi:hypothetical protein